MSSTRALDAVLRLGRRAYKLGLAGRDVDRDEQNGHGHEGLNPMLLDDKYRDAGKDGHRRDGNYLDSKRDSLMLVPIAQRGAEDFVVQKPMLKAW